MCCFQAAADTDSDPHRLWTSAVSIASPLTTPDCWKCLGWRNSLCSENTFLERGNAHSTLLGHCVPLGYIYFLNLFHALFYSSQLNHCPGFETFQRLTSTEFSFLTIFSLGTLAPYKCYCICPRVSQTDLFVYLLSLNPF